MRVLNAGACTAVFMRTNHRSGIVRAHQCLADQKTSPRLRRASPEECHPGPAIPLSLMTVTPEGDLRQQHFRNGKIGLECAQIAVVDTD